MGGAADEQLEVLVAEVLASAKYRMISPSLVRAVGARELAAHGSLRAAVKETKGRLHQVAGAFLDRAPRYARWLDELSAAADDAQAVRSTCRTIMAGHASTRERLPVLEQLYGAVFAVLPPVSRLIDVACGLNPLAAPWMPLAPNATYYACDLYADMCSFLSAALPLLGLAGEAQVCDLAAGVPSWEADVALVLKLLPVLEHLRRGAGRELLRALRTPQLVVSFPTRSLGGRNVGMASTYASQMHELIAAEGWTFVQLEFPGELVYVITK